MMRSYLANYLLYYKQVSIPHVGSLRLVQRPPVVNMADKTIAPPSYVVEMHSDENITEHQLVFLSAATGKEKEAVGQDLRSFGTELRYKMKNGGFDWEGIGTFKEGVQSLDFITGALQPLVAEKVIRQDATHTVLVGDREIRAEQIVDQRTEVPSIQKKRQTAITIGWVLVGLSLLAIAVLLYSGNFTVGATGSRLSPKSWIKLNEEPSQP